MPYWIPSPVTDNSSNSSAKTRYERKELAINIFASGYHTRITIKCNSNHVSKRFATITHTFGHIHFK